MALVLSAQTNASVGVPSSSRTPLLCKTDGAQIQVALSRNATCSKRHGAEHPTAEELKFTERWVQPVVDEVSGEPFANV